jgi:hypothetical protein
MSAPTAAADFSPVNSSGDAAGVASTDTATDVCGDATCGTSVGTTASFSLSNVLGVSVTGGWRSARTERAAWKDSSSGPATGAAGGGCGSDP